MTLSWTCKRFDDLGVHALHDALALRCRVFILEQGPYQDPDEADKMSWHVLGHNEKEQLVACLRIVDPGARFAEPSIGRVVTAPEMRGQGLGRALMVEGLARCAKAWPGRAVRVSAQAHLQDFYGGLGFVPVGAPYLEDAIAHIEMLRPAEPALAKETP
ncbi:MAG: GNAT family N-acetyltransferase [Simplicispira suum]|uniref:GNAT family N-acetyltransferase n=1 Tax=Simplicispira suum TaxID=2109915 RepID=UPI001C6B0ED9|nr:GNAT family N-acetyltransferase [Simplicispira suum]MBW7834945.1 GNAT family N-acetyltransferase [Simplicispira suum]